MEDGAEEQQQETHSTQKPSFAVAMTCRKDLGNVTQSTGVVLFIHIGAARDTNLLDICT